jgi:aminopeptidase YwaD
MKYIFLICLALSSVQTNAGKKAKIAKTITGLEQLKTDIIYLSSDELEGRRTGTVGEAKAAEYIANRFTNMGLTPFFGEDISKDFIQTFSVNEGKTLSDNNSLVIFDNQLNESEYTPMPFSANQNAITLIMNNVVEKGSGVILLASKVTKEQLANPHGNALKSYLESAEKAIAEGATAIYFCNDIDSSFDYTFESKQQDKILNKPVVFINNAAYKKYILANRKKDWLDIAVEVEIVDKVREGKNVAAYINNNAKTTVVLGAHYDHLGYGEDHNSTYTGKDLQIHNGADDNASGVAAILRLAEKLKNGKARKNNYIIVAFSGEELGLYGSKKFIEQNAERLKNVNYMINIDMLGRYDESKKSLTVGGVGTSPTWIPTITNSKPFFTPKWDSAGVGPSDHTSFYLKDIPVLFFFTGLHTDYHKPSDDADKINFEGEFKITEYIYSLMERLNNQPKLTFLKTKEPKMSTTSFKVTLGIMPDYTFSGIGVKADGVIEGKAAQKAGLKANDVIQQIGDYKTTEIQAYMEALSKFKKGDSTIIKVLRGAELLELPLTF